MQFLKTLFWVVVAVVMVLFARDNWQVVHVNLWAGLIADIKLPVLVLFAFLLGFVPTLIVYRARIWSLRRRLETQGHNNAGGPVPVPNPVPTPVRRSSAPNEAALAKREPEAREASDAKAWPTP
ncbi:MAG TPA: LapA family protein [Allosphingosinicella sp.]|nr:LapA family protein [Allosphingosinicella sp.]